MFKNLSNMLAVFSVFCYNFFIAMGTVWDRRYYTYAQYLQFKGIQTENDIRDIVIYARVSTRNQKDDLKNKLTIRKRKISGFDSNKSFTMQYYIHGYQYLTVVGHLKLRLKEI